MAVTQEFTSYQWIAEGGTTARTAPQHAGDLLSVKDFGAIGDGVADDSAAVAAAVATARSIFFPPGTYLVNNATVLRPSTNQTLYGIPGKSIINKQTGTNPGIAANHQHPLFEITGVGEVWITGLVIQLIILAPGCTEFGFHLKATTFGATSRIHFQNCKFINCNNYIERYVINVFIDDCEFIGNSVAEGAINTGGQYGNNIDGICQNLLIRGCYFTRCVSEAIDINWDTRNVVIAGNIFEDCCVTPGNEVIDIGGGTTSVCKNIAITGNIIYNTNFSANGVNIKLGSMDVTVSGNVFIGTRSTSDGHKAVAGTNNIINVSIDGNTIHGYTYGVYLTANTDVNTNVVIADNSIIDCGTSGIFSQNVSGKTLITGNAITTGIAVTPQNGISLNNLHDFIVSDNYVNGFLVFGIAIDAASSDGIVTGNVIAECGIGIRTLSNSMRISDNTVHDCNGTGIQFGGTHLTVTDNQAYNNSQVTADQYGFFFNAGCNYAVVTGNKAYDTQTTKTQNGFSFGVSDRVIFNNNIAYPFKTTPVNGAGGLTLSLVGTAGNITA